MSLLIAVWKNLIAGGGVKPATVIVTDDWLLEDSSGSWLLEDSSGSWNTENG